MTALRMLLLTLGAILMVIPFLWMVSTAFKTPPELNIYPPSFIPQQFNFDNFVAVFETAPFHLYFFLTALEWRYSRRLPLCSPL